MSARTNALGREDFRGSQPDSNRAAPGCDPGLRDLTPAVIERVAVPVAFLLAAQNRFAMLAGLTNNDAFLGVIS